MYRKSICYESAVNDAVNNWVWLTDSKLNSMKWEILNH